jgi:hypothetical protein
MTEGAMRKPDAWVIPGDDTAKMDGTIDARIDREGEFSKPLYAIPADARERVARALYEQAASRHGLVPVPWSLVRNQDVWRVKADAILAALGLGERG